MPLRAATRLFTDDDDKSYYTPILLVAAGFVLTGCVTINIYFPAAAAEKWLIKSSKKYGRPMGTAAKMIGQGINRVMMSAIKLTVKPAKPNHKILHGRGNPVLERKYPCINS